MKQNENYEESKREFLEENRLCSKEACIHQAEEPLTDDEQEYALKNFKL
jgi:hypothetical protein